MDDSEKDLNKVAAGRARADSLTPDARSAIARRAALSRHRKDMPRAIAEGVLPMGDAQLPCAVLDDADNTRVLTQNGFLSAIGRHPFAAGGTGSAIDNIPPFLRAKNLREFISSDLERSLNPVIYLPRNRTSGSGGVGYGYRAHLLPQVCWVYQDALMAGKLMQSQLHVGEQCRKLLKALTNFAIEDLIDKATGFEDVRKMNAIFKILDACIAKERLPYVKMFDIDFYRQIYKLNNWPFDPEKSARPGVIGKWTNDIYDRIVPGFGDAVRSRVKRNQFGKPTEKMTRHMSAEEGKPRVKEMLEATKALMRVSTDWPDFMDKLDVAYPKFDPVPTLPFNDLPRLTKG